MFLVAGVLTAAQPKSAESTSVDPSQQVVAATPDHWAEARLLNALRAERSRVSVDVAPPVAQVVTKPTEPRPKTDRKAVGKPAAARRTESAPAASGNLAAVINFALSQVGKPYGYGKSGPNAYDCSGLVKASFARIGITLPHGSGSIPARGRYVPRSQWRPGTVLYWPGHVAIYLGGTRMVHASRPGQPVAVAEIYGSPSGYNIVG